MSPRFGMRAHDRGETHRWRRLDGAFSAASVPETGVAFLDEVRRSSMRSSGQSCSSTSPPQPRPAPPCRVFTTITSAAHLSTLLPELPISGAAAGGFSTSRTASRGFRRHPVRCPRAVRVCSSAGKEASGRRASAGRRGGRARPRLARSCWRYSRISHLLVCKSTGPAVAPALCPREYSSPRSSFGQVALTNDGERRRSSSSGHTRHRR
jgi:hypothetical protein